MLAARTRVRSARNRSASGCMPSALSKSIPMAHISFRVNVSVCAARLLMAACAACAMPAAAGDPADAVTRLVREAAQHSLAQRAQSAGLAEPEFELTVVSSKHMPPSCPRPVEVKEVDARYVTRMRFSVLCPGADGWRHDVVVRASVSAKVLVAAASVPANRPLEAGDLALERRDVSATPDALSDMQLAAGKASKRALRAGDVVRSGWLLSPTLVRRGEPVRIVARSGGIEVTVAGEALDAGAR